MRAGMYSTKRLLGWDLPFSPFLVYIIFLFLPTFREGVRKALVRDLILENSTEIAIVYICGLRNIMSPNLEPSINNKTYPPLVTILGSSLQSGKVRYQNTSIDSMLCLLLLLLLLFYIVIIIAICIIIIIIVRVLVLVMMMMMMMMMSLPKHSFRTGSNQVEEAKPTFQQQVL